MRTLLIAAIICLMVVGVRGQNIIQNGSEWIDTDGDGLADGWYKGPFVTGTSISGGIQYIASINGSMTCQQIRFGQVLDLHQVAGKYTISFDLQSNCMVQLCAFWNSTNGYLVTAIPGGTPQHYEFVFPYSNETFYALEWITVSGHAAWIKIDNVVMTDGTAGLTGIPEGTVSVHQDDGSIYDLLGRKLNHEPENGIYIKNGKKYLHIKH
jgi:hypothetical protein